MKKDKRVAIYLRSSTSRQDSGLAVQREDLTEYISRKKGWTLTKEYQDKGISGATDMRPALDELMRDARRGRFDVVAVWRFDRFGRSTAHLLNSLNEFQALGIDFLSLNEAMDTSTPAGRMLYSVCAAMGEFEREIIVSRVRAGVARAKENGTRFGRPRVGYDFQRAIELRKAGHSIRDIAREVGVSRSTIQRHVAQVRA
jgi:DNA invertase Pin-like site-specific DNA recombinase